MTNPLTVAVIALLLVAPPAAAQVQDAPKNASPLPDEAKPSEGESAPKANSPVEESSAPSAASLKANSPVSPQPDSNPFGRIAMEVALGFGGELVGALGGMLILALPLYPLIYAFDHSYSSSLIAAFIGAGIGMVAGAPYFICDSMPGKGGYVPALVGSLLGMGAAISIVWAVNSVSSDLAGQLAIGVLVLPIVGAVVGYEISSALRQRALPSIAPFYVRGGGGLALGWQI